MKYFTLLIIVCFFSSGYGQKNGYKEKYPQEDVITLSLSRHIKIKQHRGKLFISEEVSKKNLFLSTDELRYAKDNIRHDTFNEISSVQAFTENHLDGRFEIDNVNEFKDKNSLIQGIFFNDQKEKTFFFPNVQTNSVTTVNYKKEIKDPHLLPSFIIGSPIPIVKARLMITFPKNVVLDYKSFNLDPQNTSFEKQEDKKTITYSWTLKNIAKINRNYDFSPLYYVPQIIPFIKSYTNGDKKINVLGDSGNLYAWYQDLIKNINNSEQHTIRKLTETIIQETTDETEKIKKIFAYVQENLNYIAFEDGLNGFIPRDAVVVYKNKYGDCKDMANILNEMLHYAGIRSYLTWIGTRKKPYSYSDVPTPVADNHMITTVITKSNDTLFLDPTAKYIPFGIPSPFIQGKEALIGISPSEFKVKKVPEIAYFKNEIIIDSDFIIKEGNLMGSHEIKVSGIEKLEFMHRLNGRDNDKPDFLHRHLKIGTKQTSFYEINYDNPGLVEDSIRIRFLTKTPKYLKKVADKYFFKPNFDSFLIKEIIPTEQLQFAKKNNHCYTKVLKTSIVIPDNFEIDFIPEPQEFIDDDMEYSISYETINDNTILIQKRITVKTLKISKDRVKHWNDFIKTIINSNKKSIVLSPKNF